MILDADKEIQKFYDHMWGKGTKEATLSGSGGTGGYATKYMVVLDQAIGRTLDGRLVREPVEILWIKDE